MNSAAIFKFLTYFRQTFNEMRTTLRYSLLFIFPLLFSFSYAQTDQSDKESLEKEFDAVAKEWHQLSEKIDNYDGLGDYCTNDAFKNQVLASIQRIHHFDSLIMDKLKSPTFVHENLREERKTLKNVEEFESEYSIPSFVKHLKKECHDRHEIEKNRKKTLNEVGSESYSGQVYLVELELYKYIHHIDKRLLHIEKHLHKVHIDDVRGS